MERPASAEPGQMADPNSLRRACSLSDLNRPPVTRRILPAPPANGTYFFHFLFKFLLFEIPRLTFPLLTYFMLIYLVSGRKKSSSSSPHHHNHHQQQQQQQLSPQKRPTSHAEAHLAMTRRLSREANLSSSPSPSFNQQHHHSHVSSPTSEEVPSYMRPTSASNKKGTAVNTQQPQRRKLSTGGPGGGGMVHGHAQSAQDLSRLGRREANNEEDSSSEAENLARLKQSQHPRSRRSSSQDRHHNRAGQLPMSSKSVTNLSTVGNPHSRSERDLTKVTKVRVRSSKDEVNLAKEKLHKQQQQQQQQSSPQQRAKMKTTTMIVSDPNPTVDVVRAPLNRQLIESTAVSLQSSADNLVQLYKRISLDHELEESTRSDFLRRLSAAAGAAHLTLKPVAPSSSSVVQVNVSSTAGSPVTIMQPQNEQRQSR